MHVHNTHTCENDILFFIILCTCMLAYRKLLNNTTVQVIGKWFIFKVNEIWSHLWFAGVRECPPWYSIVGATVTVHQFFCILHFCHTCSLCRVELVVQFPARGSTQVLLCLFPGVLWLWHFLYNVDPHPLSSLHVYTFVVSGHSWRVRLAKQVTLTPPGHLVSPLVCRGPWMSTVVLYCWCHSDSASVLLYFTFSIIDWGMFVIKVMFYAV